MSKFLLTGDWQIRDDIPVCRTDDDFFAMMMGKVKFVVQTAIEREVSAILHSGDLFDRGRPMQSQLLEIAMMSELNLLRKAGIPFCAVPGNHDLPYHNMKELHRSTFGVLVKSGYVHDLHDKSVRIEKVLITGFGWGYEINREFDRSGVDLLVGVWHGMVTEHSEFPGGVNALVLLRKCKPYDLLVTGDNHQQIVVSDGDRRLVNPGSLMRESIDQMDFKPAVFLYDSESPTVVEKILIPIQQGVISREHKDFVEERDQKIAAFVESMRSDYEVGLSFEKNLEEYVRENEVSKEVENLIWEVVGR